MPASQRYLSKLHLLLLFSLLTAPVDAENRFQRVFEQGQLLDKTPEYSLYLHHSSDLNCKEYDYGKGPVHSIWGLIIFAQEQRLPLDDYEAFFEAVVLPRFSAVSAEACGVPTPNLTQIRLDFYFDDFEGPDHLGGVAAAVARSSWGNEPWSLQVDGVATMAEARGDLDEAAAKMEAYETRSPYGLARDWIEASRSPQGHPPGMSSDKILFSEESLQVYAGSESFDLCNPSQNQGGDYFVNVTLRFSKDAEIPAATRHEYVEFFTWMFDRLLENRCPRANFANVVHYMDENSNPESVEEPAINRLRLERNQAGKWRLVPPNGPIYASATQIAMARTSPEQFALEFQKQMSEERKRRLASWTACAEQSDHPAAGGQPSARSICRALEHEIARQSGASVAAKEFFLEGCSHPSPSSRDVQCAVDYEIDHIGSMPWWLLPAPGSATTEVTLRPEAGGWHLTLPDRRPNLPSCWRGDVRVRWFDCAN